MWKWHVKSLVMATILLSPSAKAEWFHLRGETYCYPLTQTAVMRDIPACGSGQVHCLTSVECWTRNWFRTTGLVACRSVTAAPEGYCPPGAFCAAASSVIRPEPRSCPSVRDCALDPNPEMLLEQDLWRWAYTPGPIPLSRNAGSSGISETKAH